MKKHTAGAMSVRHVLLLVGVASLAVSSKAQDAKAAVILEFEKEESGMDALREWAGYADEFSNDLPPVWVLCHENETAEKIKDFPPLQVFSVDSTMSWAAAIERFVVEKDPQILGFFGARSLPNPELTHFIQYLEYALSDVRSPAAVVVRSRSKESREWLPDTFVAQAWVNRQMLTPSRLSETGLGQYSVPERSVPDMLQLLVGGNTGGDETIVDGTNVLGSDVAVYRQRPFLSADLNVTDPKFRIGTLPYELVHPDVADVGISPSQWPPRYLLENVATPDGLVIVTNTNCGYLDMIYNFVSSVQRTSGAKVMVVAMDDVSFDFVESIFPGTAVMFISESSNAQTAPHEAPHVATIGVFGDKNFGAMVNIRPTILSSILRQDFSVLWSDSDMVWLRSPLQLLPNTSDPSSAEVMLQVDGRPDNECTCFMFLKPTENALALVGMWMHEIEDTDAIQDQLAFHGPLAYMSARGLKVTVLPQSVLPTGHEYFDVMNQTERDATVMVVHNNWIRGHDAKMKRFQDHGLWNDNGVTFPTCDS